MNKSVVVVVRVKNSASTVGLIKALRDPEGGGMLKGTVIDPIPHSNEVLITGRFGQLFSMDGLAEFLAGWCSSDEDIEFVGIRWA